MLRRSKVVWFLFLITLLLTCYVYKLQSGLRERLQSPDFSRFDNVNGTARLLVPNLVHYVQFDQQCMSFVTFVCMLSAWYNHRPTKLYIHTNLDLVEAECRYIRLLRRLLGGNLQIHRLSKPTHVFGQRLSSVQHAADVARLKVLMEYGGIYLDQDVYVVKNLNRFRHFECSIGWPEKQYIGNQVILAHREARFLKLWFQLYREYRPTMWYFNAGQAPTENILVKRPDLVHRVRNEFGVENLAEELYGAERWTGWINRYTLHLLASHVYLHNTSLEENTFRRCNCTFATLADQVLGNLQEDLGDFKVAEAEAVHQDDLGDFKEAAPQPVLLNLPFEEEVRRFLSSNSTSLLKKYLNGALFKSLKTLSTPGYGSTLEDVIKTGLRNLDSSVGIFAPDPEAYSVFRPLFLPVVQDYHNLTRFRPQPQSDWGETGSIGEFGAGVLSTRIRIARSLVGFPLNSKMSKDDLSRLEQKVTEVFKKHFQGDYLPLAEISEQDREQLIEQHLLFEECDRFTRGGGGCPHWPVGRGIYLSADRSLIVWVNEEDHLRIISLEQGGNLTSVYSRLVYTISKLEEHLGFVRDKEFGYLTFCPTNIGTTIRASVHTRFSGLSFTQVREAAGALGLQVRGTAGEHSDVKGGVIDLSNSRRLGLSEFQIVSEMYNGVAELLRRDRISSSLP